MLGLALACGGLAASEVEQKARSADERVGPLVPVAVARADLREGTRLTPAAAARAFAVRQAPARFVPPDTFPSASEAVGGTLATTYPVGHQPFGVVVDPLDGRVYVSNNGGTTVSVVDPVSASVRTANAGMHQNVPRDDVIITRAEEVPA